MFNYNKLAVKIIDVEKKLINSFKNTQQNKK